MTKLYDGPANAHFAPVPLPSGQTVDQLTARADLDAALRLALAQVPWGAGTAWGLPFDTSGCLVATDKPIACALPGISATWLVFMHSADQPASPVGADGIQRPMRGEGALNEHLADYVIGYADGTELRLPIRRRHHVGSYQRRWGENCFQAVAHRKPQSIRPHHEQAARHWGSSQTRASAADDGPWVNWMWAWQNPRPAVPITALRIEPLSGALLLFGISAGEAGDHPLRWRPRRKALLRLPADQAFAPDLDQQGLLAQIQLDMGQVISAEPQAQYPNAHWAEGYNNQVPTLAERAVLIEYTAHADACFHLADGAQIPVAKVESGSDAGALTPVPPATQRVTLRFVSTATGQTVPVKLHLHGSAGEYLAPLDRHRRPNDAWFEDYAPEFVHCGAHTTTYVSGETDVYLPLGTVYLEVSKGFEIRPIRRTVQVTPDTREIVTQIEQLLPWRERGWVTADTHVHFLSPMTALIEGSAEGVNVVNLLASQWGELMTNVGDWDGHSVWGSREQGGDSEHLVRVGTENRQHIMGHISLLGYRGRIIAPMTTGGPDESALGDPIDTLVTEWARQCHKQGGLVVLPHFPNPRAEHAASIVEGDIDALEMTSWGDLYGGIDPYSLSDWYRYLNCGYLVPCVGGTDKMSADTAVGTVRTYAHLPEGQPFDYAGWMEAVRRAQTFVTYGPLLEFTVGGRPMGSKLQLGATGGTLDVTWEVASVTVPMTRVELVVNGEIRESRSIDPWKASGHWNLKLDASAWAALLVRGHYADQPEIIAAHSSPVMASVGNTPILAAADAVTILEQIEGALAYLDTVGTRRDTETYRRMRLVLESAHRRIHNRLHSQGHYHEHTPLEDHREHH